ncbi:MAG: DnaD domain protein [Candidatus Izemoplasmatales bacterium]
MNIALVKKLMDDQILDFPKLLMTYYKDIVLSEMEAFVILELYKELKLGNTFLNPSTLEKKMTIAKDELLVILDGLLKKGYLTISFVKQKNGKEKEVFLIDEVIKKLLASVESKVKEEFFDMSGSYQTEAEEVAVIIETQFHKQLKPLDIEMIQKWLEQDNYQLMDIKQALLDALKANKFSMSYVDTMLLKRRNALKKTTVKSEKQEKSEALKSFLGSFEQK